MDASRHKSLAQCADPAVGEVKRFAADVVARLVAKEAEVGADVRRRFFDTFVAAVTSCDPVSFDSLKVDLKRARITPEMLADDLIPAVARHLGEAWHQDRMSFTEVSVGTARLQALLREIGDRWHADSVRGPAAGTVLLVLPEGEQHTLGACVLAGQLRRRGISVCVCLGPTVGDLRNLVRRRRFDGVMLSLGSQDNLDVCHNLVKTIREGVGEGVRIAIGGAILERERDLAARLGADIATNDAASALAALGLDGDAGLASSGV
ncbi:cobalamin B12-binding domain-containing protein [Rhodobacter sp. Har01]|uniref:cobalamin B12-binding domain-containing protein n=1 Tax=Rhodobacter sp. Har01 TaxID=2883999 RepID=UPI001D094CAC|nr:cobalamin B12-binding domain-containing protein [Rhodobacter sp. Har01]MCB6176809.1 cobalamin B12-binding domain-containing protein [Rhodobacter sp. Har01]